MSKTKPERHLDICKEINDLYAKKNHDYGDSFHQTFVEEGFAMSRIRLSDKFNRFKTLSRGTEAAVKDESIRDTLIDLANYAIMTVLEMDDAKQEANNDIYIEKPFSTLQLHDDKTQIHKYRIDSEFIDKLEIARDYAKTALANCTSVEKVSIGPIMNDVLKPEGRASFDIYFSAFVEPTVYEQVANVVQNIVNEEYTLSSAE